MRRYHLFFNSFCSCFVLFSTDDTRGSQGSLGSQPSQRSARSGIPGVRHSSSYHTGVTAASGAMASQPAAPAIAIGSTGDMAAALAIDPQASIGAYYVPEVAASAPSIPHTLTPENLKRQEMLRLLQPVPRPGAGSRPTSTLIPSGRITPLSNGLAQRPISTHYGVNGASVPPAFNSLPPKRSSSQPVAGGVPGTLGPTARRQQIPAGPVPLTGRSKAPSTGTVGLAPRPAGMRPAGAARVPLISGTAPGTRNPRAPVPLTSASRGRPAGAAPIGPRPGITSGRPVGARVPTQARGNTPQRPLTTRSKAPLVPRQTASASAGGTLRSASRDRSAPVASASAASTLARGGSLRAAPMRASPANATTTTVPAAQRKPAAPNPAALAAANRRSVAEAFQQLRSALTAAKLGVAPASPKPVGPHAVETAEPAAVNVTAAIRDDSSWKQNY